MSLLVPRARAAVLPLLCGLVMSSCCSVPENLFFVAASDSPRQDLLGSFRWDGRENYPDPRYVRLRLYRPEGFDLSNRLEFYLGERVDFSAEVRRRIHDSGRDEDCQYDEIVYDLEGAELGTYQVVLRESRLPAQATVADADEDDWTTFEGERALIGLIEV